MIHWPWRRAAARIISTPRAWLASFVRRWHANPDLCDMIDPVGWHGGRMAILALHYWPDASRALLVACLTHDLGELGPGDVPHSAKRRDATLKATLDRLEVVELADMGMCFDLNDPQDRRRLKWLDRLDAYLMARKHRPELMQRADWRLDEAWVWHEAQAMGVAI